ncbi:MAG: GNAT family N-acetyltransferase, partial [Lachnospiraceae bacterium]
SGKCATLGIAMKNTLYKDRGFGTKAELLATDYVFNKLDIPVLYADAVLTNTRSQHVLEKVGFQLIRQDETYKYYRIDRSRQSRRWC